MERLLCLTLVTVLVAAAAAAQPAGANYDEAKVPAYTLPDPLRLADGTPVRNASDWTAKRRPELLRLFEEHVYGRSPGQPSAPRGVGGGDRPSRPRRPRHPPAGAGAPRRHRRTAPLSRSFSTCRTPRPDPRPPSSASTSAATTRSTPTRASGSPPPGSPTAPASRLTARPKPRAGSDAAAWPVERILDRGYALATVYYGDIEPDHADGWKDGVRARIGPGAKGPFRPDDWGAIGAWAWGLSRALDYLQTDPDVDARRVAVIGHSRLGKTALWAGRAGRALRDGRLQRLGRRRGGPGAAQVRRDERRTSRAPSPTGSAPATASTPGARRRSPWTSTSCWPSSRRARSTSRARPRTSGPTRAASSWPRRRPSPSTGSSAATGSASTSARPRPARWGTRSATTCAAGRTRSRPTTGSSTSTSPTATCVRPQR